MLKPWEIPANLLSKITAPDKILDHLTSRFTEMANSYNAGKSCLPSCLRKYLNQFLSDLESGNKALNIWWWKNENPKWEELIGDERGDGQAKAADTIYIWTAFKNRYHYSDRMVLTADLLFHELAHTVKLVYPKCFKYLDHDAEELSTNWANIKIFGTDNANTFYEDSYGTGKDQCTYKIVCKCIDGCPKEGEGGFRDAGTDSGDGCEPSPPEVPGGDQPDDNYSYFRGIIKEYNLAPEALIFTSGHWQAALKLFGGLEFDENNTAEKLLKVTPFLIIPTGCLMSMQNDSTFKYILEQYVNLGGTIIVFAQQYGSHVENVVPVPEGESLNTYGWREDQSCLRYSAYFEKDHPALSSSTNETINAGVDGYFSRYPSSSTILLKRKSNLEPALLYYPYGNGMVILTSMFTDWASAHSQASASEIKIIRDLITFAKNPRLPIPMYDLASNPTPLINLNVELKNNTEFPSSKAKLMVYTPDRNILLHELEAPVNLNQKESTQIAVNFTLPELQTKDYGICHVDYQLYDAENNLTQLPTESDSGRFSIYKIITPATIKEGVYQWVTVKDENVYYGQDAEFTMHFKNTTNEPKTLAINNPFFDFGHGWIGDTFSSFTVNLSPGEQYDHMVLLPTTQFPTYLKGSLTVRIQYYDANGILKQVAPAKVIFLLGAMTESTLKLNGNQNINQFFTPGDPLNFEISSHHLANPLPGNSTIKLSLEKQINEENGIPQNAEYNEIKTIYETNHDFLTNGNFNYSGVYTPQPIHPGGWYRLKLEVTAPNGLKETNRYNYLYYFQSSFNVGLEPINQEGKSFKYLIPGASYTIPIKIKNPPIDAFHTYDVKSGSFEILLESPNGQEVYRKEINGITIANGEVKELSETFIFHPTEKGMFILKYRYRDETKEKPLSFIPRQYLLDGTQISIQADKTGYNYGDTANIAIDIIGAGTYHLRFNCQEAGMNEERDIQIPEGIYHINQPFQIPIGLSSSYTANVSVIDSASRETQKQFTLPRPPIAFDYQGSFGSLEARSGSNLDFNAQ
ncbi:MAG TPA: hypothetical protein VK469_23710, partial [Candidatus Kapabacteria bacterium]|nr:hypothetical protein [Candidatus Kapabacteria bacterium]